MILTADQIRARVDADWPQILGVVEDRAGMENFVSSWLAQKNAAAQEGIVYRIAQDITYEEVRIDAAYCATLEEVENAFVKHATLDLA